MGFYRVSTPYGTKGIMRAITEQSQFEKYTKDYSLIVDTLVHTRVKELAKLCNDLGYRFITEATFDINTTAKWYYCHKIRIRCVKNRSRIWAVKLMTPAEMENKHLSGYENS